jgi:lysophospholipase L1-like esterase
MISSAALASERSFRFVALGDSYTIGTGAQLNESWPVVITARLQSKGVPISLVGNLGHNGWTSQNLIDNELPQLKQLNPDFVTLLIGANDWVQGVDAQAFQKNVEYIIGELLKTVPDPKHILVITIPDFSITPTGKQFSYGRDIARGIKEFNQVLIKTAQSKSIKVVDIFPLSQTMGQDPSLTSPDGLHPSSKGYAKWADLIEPAVGLIYAYSHQ